MNHTGSDQTPTGTPPGDPAAGAARTGSTNAPSGEPGSTAQPAPGAMGWGTRSQRRAARDERRELRRQRRDGSGALVAGLVLILIGGYFLVRTYVPAIDVDRAWPIVLIAIGAVLLARSVRGSSGPSV